MKRKTYRCLQCGEEFTVEVITREEAADKRMPFYPIQCPKCHSQNVRPS